MRMALSIAHKNFPPRSPPCRTKVPFTALHAVEYSTNGLAVGRIGR
jgi:hypothetical protein